MRAMTNVVRLECDPAPFLENDVFWSSLEPDQKEALLIDGARAEIDKVLSLFATQRLDATETRELVLRFAKVASQG